MILRWLAWRNASELALLIARSMSDEPDAWNVGVGGFYEGPLGLKVLDNGAVLDRRGDFYEVIAGASWADKYILCKSYMALKAERRRVAREEALHQMEQRRANLTESIKRLRRNRLEAA